MGIEQRGQTFAISGANLDQATLYTVFLPLEYDVKKAQEAGFNGIEVWPIRGPKRFQINHGFLTKEAKAGICSAHQSPITETLGEALKLVITSRPTLAKVVALPGIYDSIKDLENIRRFIGDIPVVLYRETELLHQQLDFQKRLIQPDPDVWVAWGVRDVEDLVAKIYAHGFNGVCFDTNHFRRGITSDGRRISLPPWQETLPVLFGGEHVKEIHIGVRPDRPAIDRETSLRELADLMNGTESTELMEILKAINQLGWHGEIVIEAPTATIREVLGKKSLILTPSEVKESYQRIRRTLSGIFSH